MERKTVFFFVVAALLLAAAPSAFAYRPFDSTDADVAKAGETELELGPLGRLREGNRKFAVAPALVANFGLPGDRELVVQGQHEVALNREEGAPHSALVENGVFIKQVLRRGVLQDQAGPSIATEYGLLLPPIPDGRGSGLSLAGIVSQRWDAAALHLNAAVARTREYEPDVFLGAILEGPNAWRVRPVAEIFTERAAGSPRVHSRLVGAIWRARENLSFDVGLRYAQGFEPVHEIRLGLTWSFGS
jgi:hypothetical protein